MPTAPGAVQGPPHSAQVYANATRYDIVGPPAALEATPDALTVAAAARTSLAALNRSLWVRTVDWYGQRVLGYDRTNFFVTASLLRESLTDAAVATHQVSAPGDTVCLLFCQATTGRPVWQRRCTPRPRGSPFPPARPLVAPHVCAVSLACL